MTTSKASSVKGNKRHSWMAEGGYTLGVKARCTRCNIIREALDGGSKYFKKGVLLKERPDCTQDQNAQWYE